MGTVTADDRSPADLRGLLKQRGLSQVAASVVGDCSEATISLIVNGKTRARAATILNLARGLGVSPKRMRAMCDAHWLAVHPDADPRSLPDKRRSPQARRSHRRPAQSGERSTAA